ncbi:hypothetical protein [Actinokineospora fastidiosa]|uniref:Uncharacterized protein n=1 Tax=Actinokineospora fastidiosa TaxID=1816 RepID=A0A918G5E4_9PSEU|nr:hypothetical protein [Actinokineospora fastidiosa]GGS20456.1 hypothetical protein GCM10010171_11390 [Actinokineospora fastidiosa]
MSGLAVFIGAGLLTLPFYRAELLHERFVGAHAVPANALTAVVLLAVAVAVVSLLRRDFVRLHPARLTWDDTGDRDRIVHRAMVRAWALRFGIVAYLFVAAGFVLGWSGWPALLATTVAAALYAYAAARRARRGEHAVPFGLAAAGAAFVPSTWLWIIAGVLLAATAAVWGPPPRPGRRELVRGHLAHVARAVAASFGDVLSVLPRPRPTRGRLGTTLRFVVTGIAARRGMVAAAVLLALAAPVLHAVFPVVAPVWWAGLGAYFAVLPFAGGLAEVSTVAGLRRWLPQSDTELWLTAVVVLMVVAGLWLAAAALAGLPAAPAAIPVAAVAVARTVSRPDLDYSPGPTADLGGVAMPVNLVRQLVRGPFLLVMGLAALS